ncbi:hypothetical protein D7Y07_10320 [Bacteroides acidifaciens]|uniref:Uncharacterized protein n=1 Tax=Bacteroides acidifaciens TaxID=85831 RepID=A0A3L8A792_9BACE|nr:hypothetical protein D7Y07_10320 [Bacteroides acidifaciens]HCN14012.1 hypothetical protein [Alistipes sp.]
MVRKLGINFGKGNTYGSVTKQCYVTPLYREPLFQDISLLIKLKIAKTSCTLHFYPLTICYIINCRV